jgi:hypothetical protein
MSTKRNGCAVENTPQCIRGNLGIMKWPGNKKCDNFCSDWRHIAGEGAQIL